MGGKKEIYQDVRLFHGAITIQMGLGLELVLMTANRLSYVVNIEYKEHNVVHFSGRPILVVIIVPVSVKVFLASFQCKFSFNNIIQ